MRRFSNVRHVALAACLATAGCSMSGRRSSEEARAADRGAPPWVGAGAPVRRSLDGQVEKLGAEVARIDRALTEAGSTAGPARDALGEARGRVDDVRRRAAAVNDDDRAAAGPALQALADAVGAVERARHLAALPDRQPVGGYEPPTERGEGRPSP
jgi:hypothetical protein